ncbi:phage tail protein [Roseibium alexandrii]|uniref:phage tail protein n=1 Tax=Roseibium alexandrii TaxID=388408 RepID=UPI0037535F53
MLYMIGTLAMDTRPFNADEVTRNSTADLAEKPVIGGLAPSEFTGEGKDEIALSGLLIPSKIGGLTELETAHQMRMSGARVPIMRGDGFRLGTFSITKMSETHRDLLRNGVGFSVKYTITLKKVQPDDDEASSVISGLLNLFDAFRN